MKFQVTLKSPDAADYAVTTALVQLANELDLSEVELEKLHLRIHCRSDDLPEELLLKKDELQQAVNKWIRHGEYVTIEIDTEANTATVVEWGRS